MKIFRNGYRSNSSRRKAVLALLAFSLPFLGSASAKAASLANPFPEAEHLSQDEISQISSAFEQALAAAKPGTVVVWKSAESGRTGQVRVLRSWEGESGACVELLQRFSKGSKATYEVPFCQGQDGSWKVTF